MSRSYSARVLRFRRGVYGKHDGLTNGCRVLLLRLSDDMDAKCIVSIPRNRLAADLEVAPARITEWIGDAKRLGFLSVVRRARPGVTAVYQGLVVAGRGTPGSTPVEVRPPGRHKVRQGVPLENSQRYALGGSQVVGAQRDVSRVPDSATKSGHEESDGCGTCHGYGCPRCTPDESEAC